MKARWRARISTSYRAEGCSSASRQSRMMFKIVTALALRFFRRTDAPERPLVVAPPCQSDIKRTLRAPGRRPGETRGTLFSRGFLAAAKNPFDPNGERPVSGTGALWFRNSGRAGRDGPHQSKIYAESNP